MPAELQALSDRIGRLRERLKEGDPDLEPDEIQAAIARAEQKRNDALDTQPVAKRSAKMLAALPRAAEAYRRQVEKGLQDDPRAAGKARVLLQAVGTDGSGGRIWHFAGSV